MVGRMELVSHHRRAQNGPKVIFVCFCTIFGLHPRTKHAIITLATAIFYLGGPFLINRESSQEVAISSSSIGFIY